MTQSNQQFYNSWWRIQELCDSYNSSINKCLAVMVAHPNHQEVDSIEVWLEFGVPECTDELNKYIPGHDINLDCGAATYEQAIIKLDKLLLDYGYYDKKRDREN